MMEGWDSTFDARTADRAARISGENLLQIFESFVTVTYIARQAGGR